MAPQPPSHNSSEFLASNLPNEQFLENLVKTDSLAYRIWNITRKYNLSISLSKCRTELETNPKLIAYTLINLSLGQSTNFLYYYSRYDDYYKGNSIKHGRLMYESRKKVVKDQELYLKTVKTVIQNDSNSAQKIEKVCSLSPVSSACGCVLKDALEEYELRLNRYIDNTEHLWQFVTFGSYLDPTLRSFIMIIGLVLNGVLLFIFINEQKVRTESNIMIFNLVLNNVFMLLFYLPTNYITMYHLYNIRHASNMVYLSVQIFVVSASATTLLLLNVQRYFDISRILDVDNQNNRLNSTHRCVIYSAVIWTYSTAVAVLFLFFGPYEARGLQILIYFLVYLFIFSIIMAVFNSMTARKLQRSALQGQSSNDFSNITGSAVILHLTLVYYLTHVLYFIYSLFDTSFAESGADYFSPFPIRIVIFILHIIFFSYPCLNVLALYKCSGTYRSFLNFYLFRCWYDPEEGQYATMTSGENTDSQRLFA